MTFPDAEAKALEGLLKAATPGPWQIGEPYTLCLYGLDDVYIGECAGRKHSAHDAALIVAMRNSIERLLSDRARMREALEAQVKAFRIVALRAGFTAQDISVCTTQARAALALAGEGT